jgi:S-DNA-T family DNA segregation ATPase FtsK/SpoIIIE
MILHFLSALGIKNCAPIPGKGTIGIEVPNKNPTMVSMKVLLDQLNFRKLGIAIALGKTISNENFRSRSS